MFFQTIVVHTEPLLSFWESGVLLCIRQRMPVGPWLHAQSLGCLWLIATPWTVAHQAPLSVEFPRQEYWSGLLFLSTGDLPDQGIEPASPALAGGFFTTEPPGKTR